MPSTFGTLLLKNFRCFDRFELRLDGSLGLLVGKNGSGKTAIIEALHYLCYMKSFRTAFPNDLVKIDSDGFFIKFKLGDGVAFSDSPDGKWPDSMQVGFSGGKRLARVGSKRIDNFRNILIHYKALTVTEQDLFICTGEPLFRRQMLDSMLFLMDVEHADKMRRLRAIIKNRNALLCSNKFDLALWELLTSDLYAISTQIMSDRLALTDKLNLHVQELLDGYFDDEELQVRMTYKAKNYNLGEVVDEAVVRIKSTLLSSERRYGRSLFGAHLDDLIITLNGKDGRRLASRGQQKMLSLLFKLGFARAVELNASKAILLIDDFMTDLDLARVRSLIHIVDDLRLPTLFTCPAGTTVLEKELRGWGAWVVNLDESERSFLNLKGN